MIVQEQANVLTTCADKPIDAISIRTDKIFHQSTVSYGINSLKGDQLVFTNDETDSEEGG